MPSITKRNGRFRAEVVRRPRRWSKTFNTLGAARAWALDLEDFLDRGGDPDRPDRLTVGQWEKVWWKARIVERTTRETDRSRLDVHILSEWANVPLERVTPMAVQAWVRRLEAQGLAGSTVASCHVLLSGMMAAAVREGLVLQNPCRETRLPAAAHHREVYLTHDEVRQLLAAAAEPTRTIILTFVLTGLRWGELTGLRVASVDVLRRRIDVVRAMTRYGPKEYTKTRDHRSLPIPQMLVDALAAHLVGHDGGLVFNYRGRPLNYSSFRRHAWTDALDAAQLDKTPHIHDLRHTYASHLVQAGIPLEKVTLLLGHKKITTTMRYAHFAPDHAMDAVRVLDGIWSGVPEAYDTGTERF